MQPAASRRSLSIRSARLTILACLATPIIVGLLGVFLPAFGYFPALGGHRLNLGPATMFLATPGLGRATLTALAVGLAATALSLFLAFALLAAAGSWLRRSGLQRLMGPLIAVPHSAMAIGILFLLAPSGWLMRLISPELTGFIRPPMVALVPDQNGVALTFALLAKEIPFILLVSLSAISTLPTQKIRHVGTSLGYSTVTSWWLLILPLVYRQIRLPLFAVLIFSLSVVDMTVLLGPSLPPTLAVLVVEGFQDADLARRFPASFGALMQIIVTGIAVVIWVAGEKLVSRLFAKLRRTGLRLRIPRLLSLAMAVLAATPLFAGTAGLLAAALWSFAAGWFFPAAFPSALTLQNWERIDMLLPALLASLVVAVISSLTAICIVILIIQTSRGRRMSVPLQLAIYAPLLLPQISFVLGLQMGLTFLHLDGSWAAMIWLHTIFILPYCWLIISPAATALDSRYDRVAASLGQSRWSRFFGIFLPLISPSLITAIFVGISVSIALYLPSLFAGAGRITTVTLEAVALASGGSRQMAGVATMLQLIIPVMAFVVLHGWQRWRFGRFAGMQGGINT